MLRSAKPGLRPDLRNRLVGDIPNPRMIANFVVRLSVVSLRWLQSHIIKKQGKADPESIHFCPALSSLRLQFFPLLSGSFPFLLQIIAIELLHDLSGHQNRSSLTSQYSVLNPVFEINFCICVLNIDFSIGSSIIGLNLLAASHFP